METIILIVNIIMILCSVVLIAVVLMQEGKSSGLGALTGGSTESFFGKHQSSSREGRLQRLTTIFIAIIAVLSIAMVLLSKTV